MLAVGGNGRKRVNINRDREVKLDVEENFHKRGHRS